MRLDREELVNFAERKILAAGRYNELIPTTRQRWLADLRDDVHDLGYHRATWVDRDGVYTAKEREAARVRAVELVDRLFPELSPSLKRGAQQA